MCTQPLIQDTRYKILYFMQDVHSYNIIYITLQNKIQCVTYNDRKILIQLFKI